VPEAESGRIAEAESLRGAARGCKIRRLARALKEHVKAKIGPWKYPRWIDVVDSLPKNRYGEDPAFQIAGWGG